MTSTRPRTRCVGTTRHLGGGAATLALILTWALCATPLDLEAQSDAWRAPFAAGQEARAAGEHERYAREMATAARAMDPGMLNRPFVQYHAARAHALLGRPEAAAEWLERMWEEEIEALMLTFAAWDPAFDEVREAPAVRAILDRPASMELEVRPVGGSVRLVRGAGANVLASVGPDGVLLVDTGYRAALPALRRALAAAGAPSGRVDILVLTHPHEDHWGAVAALADEAQVLAHPGTAEALAEPLEFMEDVVVPPRPPEVRPDRRVRDTTFVFNGEEVRILGVEAHTGADLAVHFTDARVLALGDTWLAQNPLTYPGADDPAAFLDRLEALLAALPPRTVVVGGHDPPTEPAEVLAQIARTRGCLERARAARAEGLDAEGAAARGDETCPAPWMAFLHRAVEG